MNASEMKGLKKMKKMRMVKMIKGKWGSRAGGEHIGKWRMEWRVDGGVHYDM